VVLPISFYELAGHARFNSIAIIDADGKNLGIYRKSHIPDGPGYHEKYYFNPGDTGFKVWNTRYATIGVGICWDQWFPECARSMALLGAEILFYPTAIGSEPHDPSISSRDHWQRVQQGHAGANLMPLIASNRIGREDQGDYHINFYGSSFIADQFGAKVQEANETDEAVLMHSFDLISTAH
jgi:N-carbamoylputrescine amidase